MRPEFTLASFLPVYLKKDPPDKSLLCQAPPKKPIRRVPAQVLARAGAANGFPN